MNAGNCSYSLTYVSLVDSFGAVYSTKFQK